MTTLNKKLDDAIGKENIIEDKKMLKNYSQDLHYPLIQGKIPDLIVKPKSLDEVQKIAVIANELKTPIVPKSSKLNRYGGTLPEKGGTIVDLQKMNQIIDIDPVNMHVVIEPGVTFKQLQEELDKFELRILPTIFSPFNSVISSYLSRYPTYAMPKFEYNDLVINLEVVLANGEIFRTGSMASAKSPPVYPYGSSVDFFRLFHGARGGLGIITKASIRVKPKPKIQEMIAIPFQNHEDFINFVYEVERKEIGTECLILNKINALKYLQIENKDADFPNWIFLICLEGPQRFPEDKIAYEKEALNEIINKYQVQAEKIELISQLENQVLKEFNGHGNKENHSYDLPLYLTLNKFPAIISAIQSELEYFNAFKVDLGVSIIPMERNRVAYVEFDLYTELKEDDPIIEFRKLFKKLGEIAVKSGAIIDIPYGPLKEIIYSNIDGYLTLINDVKKIFDPNKIMNPGKIEWEIP